MTADAQPGRERFIAGMSHAANSVSVVATDGPAGRFGVTVSAMSSVSADSEMPTLLVCVHHLSPACSAILSNRVFCVNLLRDDQSFVADTFAGRIQPPGEDKFSCTNWIAGRTGSPVAADHLVAFDCELLHDFTVGSHVVFVGQVVDTVIHEGHAPLIYANRGYGTPMRLDRAATPSHDESSNSLRIGCFFTLAPIHLPKLIGDFESGNPDADVSFIVGHQGQVQEALRSNACDVALSYDLHWASDIVIEELSVEKPYALLPAGSPLAASSHVSMHDLAEQPMILLQRPPSEQYFTSLFSELGLTPRIKFKTPSFEMVRGFVGRGLGYSILITRPDTDRTYDGSSVVAVPLLEEVTPGRIVMATVRGQGSRRLVKRFADLCHKHFAKTNQGGAQNGS